MKIWIKVFFISIGLVCVLIISLAAGLHLYVKTDHAQELVLSKINANLPGVISWQDLGISALTGYIEIRGGIIEGPQGEELIACDKLSLNLSWLGLLWGELFIEEAVIDKPWVYLGLDSSNKLMLIRAFSDQKEQRVQKDQKEQLRFPFNIVVDELVISGGSVLFETADRTVVSNLSGIEVTADADLFAQSVNLELHMAQTRYASNEIKTELQKIFVQASLKKHRIDPIIIQAQTASSTMRVMGSVKDIYENPFFDVSCDILVSLSELRNTLDLKQELKGQVDARIKASGILDNPEVNAHLDYGGGLLADMQVGSADLYVRLKDKVVTLENAHIAFASGDISLLGQADLTTAFPSGFFSGNRDIDAITYKFKTNGQGIEIAKFMPGGLIMGGTLNPVVSLVGTGISPNNLAVKVSAELDIKKLAIDDVLLPVDVSLKTQGSIQKRIIQVNILEARSGQSSLEANALLDLSSEKIDALVKLNVQDLKQGLSPVGIVGKGRIGLTARISQTFTKPALEFSLNGEKVSLANISFGDFVCTADLDQSGDLKISRFVLENQGSKIQGSGSMKIFEEFPRFRSDKPVRFAATLTDVELQDFMNSQGVRGSFDGEISLAGSLQSPDAKLFLLGMDVSFGSVHLGDIEASSHFEQGTIEVDQIIVKNRNSRMNMSGTVKVFDMITGRFYEDPPVQVNIVGNPVFLEDVIDKFKGRLAVNASIEGSVRNPRGTLRLSGTEIDFGFEKIHEINISSRIEDKKLTMDGLEIVLAEDETITGTGWVSLAKEYAFELKSAGISFENIRALEGNRIVRGRVSLNASGRGTIDDPGLKARIVLADVFMNEKKLDDQVINIDLEDHAAKVSGNLNFAFSGSYKLKTREFSASAVFDHTDLTPYFQIARRPGLTGKVDGNIHASGNTHDFKTLEALMDLTYLDLFYKDNEIVHTSDLKVLLTRETLSVPGAHIILGKQGWLDIEGKGDLHGAVSLTAQGDIPLIVAQPFVENLTNLDGSVLISARIEAARPGTDIQADIEMKGIGMNIPLIEERLHSTSGHITITPNMVLFEGIAGKLGTGSFDLGGKIELKDVFPERIGLKLSARSLPIRIPDILDLYADLEVLLQGTPEESIMQGKAILQEGTYYRDVKLSLLKGIRTIVEKRPPVRPARKKITIPFLKNMKLDISVKRRNPLYVDNNIAQLDINPDLLITGTLNNPIVNGRASIVSGTVEFRNRTFTVTKGVVDFLNPYRTEATIDLESEVKVRDWMIYLKVTGTPDALNLSLRSDPEEEDNDILSLLVLGKTSRELIAGEGGSSQTTSAMIASLVTSTYGEDFKEATGLDILEIESGADQEDSAETVKVTIGKELSRRITLKYAMESKNSEPSQRAIAEYKLLENILVNGFQDTRGGFGGDILFRLEFR